VPGSFGGTAKADGVRGTTTGKDSAGVFGKNDATAAPTKGGDGGAGVLGVAGAPGAAGVLGASTHASKGVGVQGNGPEAGVSGFADSGAGVRGHSNHANGAEAFAHDANGNAVLAINDATTVPTTSDGTPRGCGVLGVTTVPDAAGVFGANNSGAGVGLQANGPDVGASGYSRDGAGVRGVSNNGNGVFGFATPERLIEKVVPGLAVRETVRSRLAQRDQGVQPASGGRVRATVQDAVVSALQNAGDLGVGHSSHRAPLGLLVTPAQAIGVVQHDKGPVGNGVWGHTSVSKASGVFGSADPRARGSAGVTGIGPVAGQFFGNAVVTVNLSVGGGVSVGGDVNVTGDVILTGADIAEDFDALDLGDAEPGTVMVIGENGSLQPSRSAYDAAVAGVVSAAGDFRPGVVLDRGPDVGRPRVTLALVGKVFCRVDASEAPIRPGDLLTTSAVWGHAMKVTNPLRAVGAVLGKALRPLSGGQAVIPILVALQ
jgi:hypothetical protein